MVTLDYAWVDSWIQALAWAISTFRKDCDGFHFEPTEQFYEALGSDSETCLQEAASEIALHLRLPVVPTVDFDWAIKMEPQHAGQVRLDHPKAPIRIPFRYAGRAYALGAILAHELCHVFMNVRRIRASSMAENEPLTDLMTVFSGLGKLSLNGTFPYGNGDLAIRLKLGYTPHDLLLYAFEQVNKLKKIPEERARLHLIPGIQTMSTRMRGRT